MKAAKTLQTRLVAAFILTTMTISILYGFIVFLAMKYTEDDILNKHLLLEAQNYINQYKISPSSAQLPKSIALESYLSSSPDLPDFLKQQPLGIRELHNEELQVGVFEIPNSDEWLYLSLSELDASNLEHELPSLVAILLSLCLVITVIGLLIGLLFSRIIAKPVVELTEDIKSAHPEHKQNFFGHSRTDEIGDLSRAFSELVQRLQHFIDREKQFTRYVSHELRTPISLIKNACAILKLPKQDQDRQDRNLGRIDSATLELEGLIETFLTLGRERTLEEVEINFVDIIEQYIERNQLVHNHKKIMIELEVESKPKIIKADKKLVSILVDNIIRNIYVHGIHKAQITLKQSCIVFNNAFISEPNSEVHSCGMEIVNALAAYCHFKIEKTTKNNCYEISLLFN